jgi:hypothetical protein
MQINAFARALEAKSFAQFVSVESDNRAAVIVFRLKPATGDSPPRVIVGYVFDLGLGQAPFDAHLFLREHHWPVRNNTVFKLNKR